MSSEKEIKFMKEMLMKCTEFDPLLTPNQYKVYVKHLEEAFREGIKNE